MNKIRWNYIRNDGLIRFFLSFGTIAFSFEEAYSMTKISFIIQWKAFKFIIFAHIQWTPFIISYDELIHSLVLLLQFFLPTHTIVS